MKVSTSLLGRWGEAESAKYLRKKRYKIIAMNYKTRFGEIDIIAENKGCIIFVEVKLRKSADFAEAHEFVTAKKQERIRTTAEIWLSQNDTDKCVRFDVIEIYAPNGANGEYKINHIEEAF